jgi:hypothetical protein
MVLLAGGIGKTWCAAHLLVLPRNAAEKSGIPHAGRVAVGPRTADSEIEDGFDLATGDSQVFKTGAKECHPGHASGQRMLGRNLGEDNVRSDDIVHLQSGDDRCCQGRNTIIRLCASGASSVHVGRLKDMPSAEL